MSQEAELPSSVEMRWPALIALDETAEPDALFDLLDRVSKRLHITDDQRKVMTPDGRTPLVLSRLVEALADLYSAGLVVRTDSGEVDITDEGRRVTEEMVVEMQPASEDLPTEDTNKPTWGDYLRAFLESI